MGGPVFFSRERSTPGGPFFFFAKNRGKKAKKIAEKKRKKTATKRESVLRIFMAPRGLPERGPKPVLGKKFGEFGLLVIEWKRGERLGCLAKIGGLGSPKP